LAQLVFALGNTKYC